MSTRICTGCGNPVKPGAAFCTTCGKHHGGAGVVKHQPAPPGAARGPVDPGILPIDILEAPIPPGQLTINLQRRFPLPMILIFLLFMGGLAAFFYGWISTMRVGGPYSFRATESGALLSTTTELIKFDSNGNTLWTYSAGKSYIEGMLNLDEDLEGRVYFTNTHKGGVGVLSEDGKQIQSFGDRLNTEFWLVVLKSGALAVVDTDHNKLQVYSAQGRLLREVGDSGVNSGQFRFPSGVAQLPDGTILVVDTDNLRIQLFDEQLKHLGNWTFTRNIVEREGGNSPLVIKKDSEETSKFVKFFPRSIYVDAVLERVYIGFETIYQSGRQKGHIAAFDFSGEFIEHRRPETQDGRRFQSFRMGPAPGGRVALVDPHNGYIGLWDPRGDSVEPAHGSGINTLVAERAQKRRQGRTLYWGGLGGTGISLILLFVLFVTGTKILDKESAAKWREDPEIKQFAHRRLPTAAASVRPEHRLNLRPSPIFWIISSCEFVILLIILYLLLSYTISSSLFHLMIFLVPVILIVLLSPLYFALRKFSKQGGLMKMNLRYRNGLLHKNLELIKTKLSDDEKVIDAHPYSNGMAYGLIVLTDRKIIHIPPKMSKSASLLSSGAGNRVCKVFLKEETPISNIIEVKSETTYYAPFSVLKIRTRRGETNTVPAGCPVLSGEFARRVNLLSQQHG